MIPPHKYTLFYRLQQVFESCILISMGSFLSPVSWFILVCIGIVLMIIAYMLFTFKPKKMVSRSYRQKGKPGAPGVCPICCTVLGKGEQLKTKVYPSEGTDRLCSIYGCPHCYPVEESGTNRFCPVCKASVAPESYLIARLFDRSKTNKHVRILGCKQCRNG